MPDRLHGSGEYLNPPWRTAQPLLKVVHRLAMGACAKALEVAVYAMDAMEITPLVFVADEPAICAHRIREWSGMFPIQPLPCRNRRIWHIDAEQSAFAPLNLLHAING